MKNYESRVRAGITFLDRIFRKRWLKWIDLDRLDMGSWSTDNTYGNNPRHCGCIGAQIAVHARKVQGNNYNDFIYSLNIDNSVELGFNEDIHRAPNHPRLTREWKRQIREFRKDD